MCYLAGSFNFSVMSYGFRVARLGSLDDYQKTMKYDYMVPDPQLATDNRQHPTHVSPLSFQNFGLTRLQIPTILPSVYPR